MRHSDSRITRNFRLRLSAVILLGGGLTAALAAFATSGARYTSGPDSAVPAVPQAVPHNYAFLHSLTTGSLGRVAGRAGTSGALLTGQPLSRPSPHMHASD